VDSTWGDAVCASETCDRTNRTGVYLVGFPALGVLKVAITSSRSDRRIEDHATAGGVLRNVIGTDDRARA
jgi:hypothetical protein